MKHENLLKTVLQIEAMTKNNHNSLLMAKAKLQMIHKICKQAIDTDNRLAVEEANRTLRKK